MAVKHKVVKVRGVRVPVKLKKERVRPAYPGPSLVHKSSRDYDRRQMKRETREILKEL